MDCWSSGVLAYEILAGYAPFAAQTPYETLQNIKLKTVVFPPHLSPGAVSFINRLLVRDPSQRPTVAEILLDPWLVSLGRTMRGVGRPRRSVTVKDLKSLVEPEACDVFQAPSVPLQQACGSDSNVVGKKRGSPVEFDETPADHVEASPQEVIIPSNTRVHQSSVSAPKKAKGEVTHPVAPIPTSVNRKGLVSTMLSKFKAGIMRTSSSTRLFSMDSKATILPSIVPVTKQVVDLTVASKIQPAGYLSPGSDAVVSIDGSKTPTRYF